MPMRLYKHLFTVIALMTVVIFAAGRLYPREEPQDAQIAANFDGACFALLIVMIIGVLFAFWAGRIHRPALNRR